MATTKLAGPAMRAAAALTVIASIALGSSAAQAQVAGSTVIAAVAAELRQVAMGWSTKRQIIGRPVYSDKAEVLGTVDDLIVSPEKAVSYIILNTGNIVLKHDVAIAVSRFSLVDQKLTLPGATRDGLAAAPAFQYN